MIVSLEAQGAKAYNRYAMCPAVVEITIKMKTIVRKTLMIKINKLRLRNLDNLQRCSKQVQTPVAPLHSLLD